MNDGQSQKFLDKLNTAETTTKLSALVLLRKSIISSIMAIKLEESVGNTSNSLKMEQLEKQKKAANSLILEILTLFPSVQADDLLGRLTVDNSL